MIEDYQQQSDVSMFDGVERTVDYYKKTFNDPDIEGLDYVRLEEMYASGVIDKRKRKSLLGKLDKVQKAMVEVKEVADYIDNPEILKSPFDSGDRRKADVAFMMNPLSITAQEDHKMIQTKVRNYGGIVPKQLRRQFEAVLVNGNAQQQIVASNLLKNLQTINPYVRIDRNLPEAMWQKADLIDLMVRGNPNPEAVVEKVNEYMKPIDVAAAERYRKDANDQMKKFKVSDRIAGTNLGVSSPALEAEYKRVYQSVYRGDDAVANHLATKAIENNFSVSKFGGDSKGVMEITPEALAGSMGAPNPEEYVRKDLENSLNQFGLTLAKPGIFGRFFGGEDAQRNQAFLEADNKTKLGQGFKVKYIDRDLGIPVDLVDSNGKPVRYMVPNYNEEQKQLADQESKDKAVYDQTMPGGAGQTMGGEGVKQQPPAPTDLQVQRNMEIEHAREKRKEYLQNRGVSGILKGISDFFGVGGDSAPRSSIISQGQSSLAK